MAITTTVGKLLIEQALPPEFRGQERVLDGKKGIKALFQEIAEKRPDLYRETAKKLLHLGRDVAYETGGFSFGLRDLRPTASAVRMRQQLQTDIDRVLDSDQPDEAKRAAIIKLAHTAQAPMEKAIYEESLAEKSPLAMQVLSGSRGSPGNLKSLRGADLLYLDHRDRPIPLPVLRSYSEGLSPADFFAGSFGARKGVVDVKTSVANAGAFSKVLNQITHRLVVTGLDADPTDKDYQQRGMPVRADDPDNEGALLARPAGGYQRDTVLTPRVLRDLRARMVEHLVVRSPIAGASPEGGLYARDVGIREHSRLLRRGELPGLAGAQAIGEPVSQGGLSSKHSGGVAGAATSVSGFPVLKSLVEIPEHFPGGGAHAQQDGRVERIEPAPAGGQYLYIDNARHYVPAGQQPQVKHGDTVEAGDLLSDGLPNPSEIVKHKGVGEGRRYFVDTFRQALKDAGIYGHRRNIELLARGLINHVRLTEEMGHHVPDDVVSYDTLEHSYEPRHDAEQQRVGAGAVGRYLEKPVLHYTIGTRVTPSVVKTLQRHEVKDVTTHREPPPFVPEMIRGHDVLLNDQDWLVRMFDSNLKRGLLNAAHRGSVSDEGGTSFVPSLARAVDFGRTGVLAGLPSKP